MKNAERYIKLGITIIPQNKKVPLVKWQKYQTERPTPEEIKKWKRDFPTCGIGAVSGPASRFIVLDIDGDTGKQSIAGKELPNTWMAKTPRGRHYFFQWEPRFSEFVTSQAILPNVDVKGQGGLVTLPNIELGRWWVKGHSPETIPLAKPPQWLIDLLPRRNQNGGTSNPPGWIADAFKGIQEGNRNETFTRIIGRLHRDRWSNEDIVSLLSPHADEHSFSVKELKRIIASISRYPNENSSTYEISDGQICIAKHPEGHRILEPLCNFEAHAIEEIVNDNGQETTRAIAIEGKLANGPTLPKVTVPLAEFGSMRWVSREWGMAAIVRAGQSKQDQLREAIQRLSPKIPERRIYTHTGWRKIREKWVYLHAQGAVGANDLHVELEPGLEHYALPKSYTNEELKAAALRTRNLLYVCAPEMALPLFSAIHLAPFASHLNLDFTVWLLGSTGSLKSTLASLFLSFFGYFERTNLPTNWESTENALEKRCFTLKDSLLVIDDFAPPSSFDSSRDQERKAQRIIRAVGNRSGRDRLRSDLTSRACFVPRCFLLSTGEQLPAGQSILARVFCVPCSKKQVNMEALKEAQKYSRLLPIYMADFISQSAENFKKLVSNLKKDFEIQRETFQGKSHLRIPEMLAWMQIGFDLGMANLSRHVGGQCLATLKTESTSIFTKLGEQQVNAQSEEKYSHRFLSVLWALLGQGRAFLSSLTGQNVIGWSDQNFIYLRPLESYNAVCKFMKDEGGYFGLKPTSLHKMLHEDGYLVKPIETNRYVGKETCPSAGQVRVLKLDRDKVEATFGPLPTPR